MVREVTFTDGKQTLDCGLQLVVNPDTTHRVVDGGEDHHRVIIFHTVDFVGEFTGIHVGDFLIHIKEVTVALANNVDAEALDRLREVEEYSQTRVVHTEALVATLLSSTRSNVTWHEVTESGIAALQIVVAVFLRNIRTLLGAGLQSLGILNLLGHPDTTIVTQRLRHQRQLRLLVTMNGDTSGVNLNVRRICEISTLTIALNGSCTVAAHSIG